MGKTRSGEKHAGPRKLKLLTHRWHRGMRAHSAQSKDCRSSTKLLGPPPSLLLGASRIIRKQHARGARACGGGGPTDTAMPSAWKFVLPQTHGVVDASLQRPASVHPSPSPFCKLSAESKFIKRRRLHGYIRALPFRVKAAHGRNALTALTSRHPWNVARKPWAPTRL